MKTVIIIPARYKSTRFPGKPLAKILGKSMIQRVWIQCSKVMEENLIYVATDSEEISHHCNEFGINVIMTNTNCLTGTDRVYEASKKINADLIINVQGDEPLVSPTDIEIILNEAKKNPNKIYNAMCPIIDESEYRSLSIPKVVYSKNRSLLYMSRAPIPQNKENSFKQAFKQVCIYAYPINALEVFYKNKKTKHEKIEDIEILRFLELGFNVNMIEVSNSSIAVDFQEDILKVENAILKRSIKV